MYVVFAVAEKFHERKIALLRLPKCVFLVMESGGPCAMPRVTNVEREMECDNSEDLSARACPQVFAGQGFFPDDKTTLAAPFFAHSGVASSFQHSRQASCSRV
jgi:hypothetical protein